MKHIMLNLGLDFIKQGYTIIEVFGSMPSGRFCLLLYQLSSSLSFRYLFNNFVLYQLSL
jgi:hypothetical protein